MTVPEIERVLLVKNKAETMRTVQCVGHFTASKLQTHIQNKNLSECNYMHISDAHILFNRKDAQFVREILANFSLFSELTLIITSSKLSVCLLDPMCRSPNNKLTF